MEPNYDIDISQTQDFPEAMFRVVVASEESAQTTHTVRVSEAYWEKVTGGKVSAQDLVEATFDFLLKRESNDAVMREFSLEDVAKYFPEYEGVITQQL